MYEHFVTLSLPASLPPTPPSSLPLHLSLCLSQYVENRDVDGPRQFVAMDHDLPSRARPLLRVWGRGVVSSGPAPMARQRERETLTVEEKIGSRISLKLALAYR